MVLWNLDCSSLWKSVRLTLVPRLFTSIVTLMLGHVELLLCLFPELAVCLLWLAFVSIDPCGAGISASRDWTLLDYL